MHSVDYSETSAYIPGYVPSHPSGLNSDCLLGHVRRITGAILITHFSVVQF